MGASSRRWRSRPGAGRPHGCPGRRVPRRQGRGSTCIGRLSCSRRDAACASPCADSPPTHTSQSGQWCPRAAGRGTPRRGAARTRAGPTARTLPRPSARHCPARGPSRYRTESPSLLLRANPGPQITSDTISSRMSAVQPSPPTTKQQRVYDTLRERILNGAYGPGFRLVIDAVAAELGVSTVPVREAIRRLEAEGLVIYRPNIGAQVAPAEPELFEDELSVLALLEGYATAGAAPHLTDADIARLRETTDLMVSAMDRMDPLAFGLHNQEFHAVFEIGRASCR